LPAALDKRRVERFGGFRLVVFMVRPGSYFRGSCGVIRR